MANKDGVAQRLKCLFLLEGPGRKVRGQLNLRHRTCERMSHKKVATEAPGQTALLPDAVQRVSALPGFLACSGQAPWGLL